MTSQGQFVSIVVVNKSGTGVELDSDCNGVDIDETGPIHTNQYSIEFLSISDLTGS